MALEEVEELERKNTNETNEDYNDEDVEDEDEDASVVTKKASNVTSAGLEAAAANKQVNPFFIF